VNNLHSLQEVKDIEVKVLGFEDDTRAASCVELYFWNIQGLLRS
jgi:hypothetical protein